MQSKRPVTITLATLAIVGGSLLGATASQAAVPTTAPAVVQTQTTQYPVNGPILNKWNALGGAYGLIGSPTSPQISINGGYYQNFQAGSIYFHPSIGVPYVVTGAVDYEYKTKGAAGGALFFPKSDAVKTPLTGITVQQFQNGVITFDAKIPQSSTNMPRAIIGEFGFKFNAFGGADVLGPATSAEVTITGGRSQDFRNGTIVTSSATGARVISNTVINSQWKAMGAQVGILKFPTSDTTRSANGVTYQNFQNGLLLVGENGTTAFPVTGGTLSAFNAAGGAYVVGTARTNAVTWGNGTLQTFQNGVITTSPDGAFFVKNSPILVEWQKLGQQSGPLGYPTSNLISGANGSYQKFERGVITSGPTGTYPVYGPVADTYAQLGGTPVLGAANGYYQQRFNGIFQSFEGGTIASSATTGGHLISNPVILNLWNGGAGDSLRLPVEDSYTAYDGSTVQKFEGGVVVVQLNGAFSIIWGSDAQGPARF